MTIYHVFNDKGYSEEFYSLTAAKKAMKEHNAKGTENQSLQQWRLGTMRRNSIARE